VEKVIEEDIYYGHGKILLMDDEQELIAAAKEMLLHLGNEVEIAQNGTEAIKLYKKAKESGSPFDAVILDLTVPGGLGGKEAVRKFKKINPEIKALVSSGYSNDPVMSEYKQYGFSGIVTKPYEIKELSKILHTLFT